MELWADLKFKRMRKETGDYGRGFSRWVNPKMDNYMMACCDCGLVHEMQFRAFKRGPVRKDGSYTLQVLGPTAYGVRFRARRAEAYTRRERAKRK
jgi:hypothetical protein